MYALLNVASKDTASIRDAMAVMNVLQECVQYLDASLPNVTTSRLGSVEAFDAFVDACLDALNHMTSQCKIASLNISNVATPIAHVTSQERTRHARDVVCFLRREVNRTRSLLLIYSARGPVIRLFSPCDTLTDDVDEKKHLFAGRFVKRKRVFASMSHMVYFSTQKVYTTDFRKNKGVQNKIDEHDPSARELKQFISEFSPLLSYVVDETVHENEFDEALPTHLLFVDETEFARDLATALQRRKDITSDDRMHRQSDNRFATTISSLQQACADFHHVTRLI